MASSEDPFVDDHECGPRVIAAASPDGDRERRLEADPRGLRERVNEILNSHPIGFNPEGLYFPDDEYDTLFTRDAIQSALGGGYMDMQLIKYVREYAKRTFATLLLVFSNCEERRKALNILRTNNFTDKDLSLSRNKLELCPCRPRCQTSEHLFPYYDPWGSTELDSFKLNRWHFLVPMFETKTFRYEFDKDQLLPFTARQRELNSGHFSDLSCVEMLVSKQDKVYVPDYTIIVALKTLKRISDPGYSIENAWEREAKAHEQLNGKRINIVQAFAAYRQIAADPQNDAYHLVLEWADGGSLLDFWTDNPDPQVDHMHVVESRQHVKESLTQLYGLADALEGMHSTNAQSPRHSNGGSVRSSPALSPEMDLRRSGDSLDAGVPLPGSSSLPMFNVEHSDDVRPDDVTVPPISIPPSDPASQGLTAPSLIRRTTGLHAENWRHGDIKPENILRFTNGKDDVYLGVLKLADLGRAQLHLFPTKMRETKEKELWRTRWYEPPDLEKKTHQQAQQKISRLFDIWSMGCVIFETVLWLLYSCDSIDVFMCENDLGSGEQDATPYWREVEGGGFKVSDAVARWMNHILQHDPERNGVIGSLVKLVQDRMLKIKLPPDSDVYSEGFGTNAEDLREQLASIIRSAEENELYLFSGDDRTNVSIPKPLELSTDVSPQSTGRSSLSPPDTRAKSLSRIRGQRTAIASRRRYTNDMEDRWKIIPDNKFVDSNLAGRHFGSSALDLCSDCENINILSPHVSFDMDKLKINSDDKECDLCELVYPAAKDLNLTSHISLTRLASNFILDGTNLEVLRLYHTKSGKHGDLRALYLSV